MGVIYNHQNRKNFINARDNNNDKIANNNLKRFNKSARSTHKIVSRKKRLQVLTSDNINFLQSLGLRIKNHV